MTRTIFSLLFIVAVLSSCMNNNDRITESIERIAEHASNPTVFSTIDTISHVQQKLEIIEYSDSTYFFTIKSGRDTAMVVATGIIGLVDSEAKYDSIPSQKTEKRYLYKSWSKEVIYCIYLESSKQSYAIIDVCSEVKPEFDVNPEKMKKE